MKTKGRKMIATMEVAKTTGVAETTGQEIGTKLGRLKKMEEDGREIEAFQLRAELAEQGIWRGDV